MTHTEIISALLDGERVDVDRLAAAIEDAEARSALVDFVAMRQAVRATDDSPLPRSLVQLPRPAAPARVLRWTAAAAILLLMFVAGLVTPLPGRDEGDAPPHPSRVERFEPGVDWQSGN